MEFSGLKQYPLSSWMKGEGPDNDIVLSSRVRLARNLTDIPFPHRAADEQLRTVLDTSIAISRKLQTGAYQTFGLSEMTALDRQILVEKHLISPDLIREPRLRGVVLSKDESIAIMVNEEDHLRIQAILPGFQLEEALVRAQKVDDEIEAEVEYAFNEIAGYLTACPTNVGTGLRASVMVHLPALVITNQIGRLLSTISHLGLAVRGLFGEGSEAIGHIYQISNQVTLGLKEEEIISNLRGVTRQLIDHERAARKALLSEAKLQIEDRTYRAFGILSYARVLSTSEATSLLSDVRLGIDLGLISQANASIFNELLVITQPAFLQRLVGREMEPGERDVYRASLIRSRLNG